DNIGELEDQGFQLLTAKLPHGKSRTPKPGPGSRTRRRGRDAGQRQGVRSRSGGDYLYWRTPHKEGIESRFWRSARRIDPNSRG
ncbi:unnamed protein product, partial [Pylaiella littoralis]